MSDLNLTFLLLLKTKILVTKPFITQTVMSCNSVTFEFSVTLEFLRRHLTISRNLFIFVSNTSQLIRFVSFINTDLKYSVSWKKSTLNQAFVFKVLQCMLYYLVENERKKCFQKKQTEHIYRKRASYKIGNCVAYV